MLNNIGVPGLILLVILLLIVFGPSKLPELGRSIGKMLREFKAGAAAHLEDTVPEKTDRS